MYNVKPDHLNYVLTRTNNRKNVIYLSLTAIAGVIVAKTMIKERRISQFSPHMRGLPQEDSSTYYDNFAQVKPGFPLPQTGESAGYERKSEFEGSGLSYMSRKRGDRLGFLDRRGD